MTLATDWRRDWIDSDEDEARAEDETRIVYCTDCDTEIRGIDVDDFGGNRCRDCGYLLAAATLAPWLRAMWQPTPRAASEAEIALRVIERLTRQVKERVEREGAK